MSDDIDTELTERFSILDNIDMTEAVREVVYNELLDNETVGIWLMNHTEKEFRDVFNEIWYDVLYNRLCKYCDFDITIVNCYSPGSNMSPEKCRGCYQLVQGNDYGQNWQGCHANEQDQRLIHF